MILGHAHPRVRKAMSQALSNGWSYGAATELEVRLAQKVSAAIPSMELVRMVSSGTEAAMSALRVARGFTGRDKIIKFEVATMAMPTAFWLRLAQERLPSGFPTVPGFPSLWRQILWLPLTMTSKRFRPFSTRTPPRLLVLSSSDCRQYGIVLPGKDS